MSGPELHARHVLEYPYRRSVGPVLGRFLAELRERRIVGIRAADGRVLVPPQEYDPASGASLSELVPVGNAGVVVSWTWVAEPRAGKHPLDRPFAFALIRLDGADTPLLHALDAAPDAVRTGMRVRARFRDETRGDIRDIACFEPEDAR